MPPSGFMFSLLLSASESSALSQLRSISSMQNWPPSVSSGCPPEAELPSSRTTLAKCCHLGCCQDFLPGYHFSHSPFCPLHFASQSQLNSPLSLHFASLSQLNSTRTHRFSGKMPRLRHNLRCRRGSTRARPSSRCHSPSTSPPTSSSEISDGRYPSTRSGRGRGHGHSLPSLIHGGSASQSPPRFSNVVSAYLANPSTALFHFQCQNNRPLVIATVSVSFKEIQEAGPEPPPPSVCPTHKQDHSDVVQPTQTGEKEPSLKAGAGSSNIQQEKGKQAGSGEAGTTATRNCPIPDDDDGYWCRIEEEPPSEYYGL